MASLWVLGAVQGDALAQGSGLIPQGGLEVAKDLSRDDMVDRASTDIDAMTGSRSQVLELLEKTREEEKDLLKLNCINEKLTAIKGFLKVSEQSFAKLQEASSRENAAHQFSLITIAGQKVQNLTVEAQSCAGEVLRYSGNTETKTEVDDFVRDYDPFELLEELEDLARLTEVTPFQ